MKSVIRVQDSEGRGMFYGTEIKGNVNKSVYFIYGLTSLCDRHSEFPNASRDAPISTVLSNIEMAYDDYEKVRLEKAKWRFSFKNLKQFEEWVTRDEVKILMDNGYRVVRIFATNVVVGEAQNIFHIDSVTRTEDITDLFL